MIKSYSKINLFLNVLKKNSSGLHNIQSTIMLLDLHDNININKIKKKKDKILFTGPFKKNIDNKENTVTKIMTLLRNQNLIKSNNRYKIVVNKKIPIFAGLGGGTGNAASIIKYFLKGEISSKLLGLFESKIGSDLRLFFFNHSFQTLSPQRHHPRVLSTVTQSDFKKHRFVSIAYRF